MLGKIEGRRRNRASEDETAGWHYQSNERELGHAPGDGEGQGGLACCSPWGLKESDMTGRLNNNNNVYRDTQTHRNHLDATEIF